MPWTRLSLVLAYLRRKRIDPALISVFITRDDLNQLRLTPGNLEALDPYIAEDEADEDLSEEG